MKIAFFDIHGFEKEFICEANQTSQYDLTFFEPRLSLKTAPLAKGFECVCIFVNDQVSREVIETLKAQGTRLIALRSAGFNNVDLKAAQELGVKVVRVPAYSPHAVAEHAVALILCLNRKLHKSYNRVREGNFSLEGLVGFDLYGKTVGVIGTGKIGKVFCQIMKGFGTNILAYDKFPDHDLAKVVGFQYESLESVLKKADILSLHLPLGPESNHLMNEENFRKMKKGVLFVNTSRGGLVDTKALIQFLKNGHLGGAALDVYEEEEQFFFKDHSAEILNDDTLARLMTFPNVLLTSHQAFLTHEALLNISETTLRNIHQFEKGEKLENEVRSSLV